MARGARPVAGRMGKLIDEHGAELDRIIAGARKRRALPGALPDRLRTVGLAGPAALPRGTAAGEPAKSSNGF